MINIEDLQQCLSQPWFKNGYEKIERNVLLYRFSLPLEPLHRSERTGLVRFSQAVMAGASGWIDPRGKIARTLCQKAADIEAGLAISDELNESVKQLCLFKAILLYDLAGLPGASSTYVARGIFDQRLQDFFTRARGSIWGDMTSHTSAHSRLRQDVSDVGMDLGAILQLAVAEIIQEAGLSTQIGKNTDSATKVLRFLTQLATDFNFSITGDDLKSLPTLLDLRLKNSSRSIINEHSILEISDAINLALPIEFWPAQVEAIENGILSDKYKSFGLASPTGTGKTSLTKLVIADNFRRNPGKKLFIFARAEH